MTRFYLAACALFASVWLASAVDAGTIRDDRADSLYFDLAAQPQYDPVGRLTWTEPAGSFLGSGVLISEEWVLTAAHVVDGTDGAGAGLSNLNFTIDGSVVAAESWVPHPNWFLSGGESNLFAGWDIGLVQLESLVTSVAPATLYTDRDELAQVATLVGFGTTGTGLTGATQPGGTKRAGQNVIDAVGTDTTPGSVISPPTDRLVTVDFDQPGNPGISSLGNSTPLELEYLTAPGDSGGGLFIDVAGETFLAGVTSLGSSSTGPANSDYGDRASFTRVSSFVDWIELTTGLDFTTPVVEGDFNGDTLVNAADYAVLRDLGLPVSAYDEFAGNFGTPPVAPAIGLLVVPEPSAWLLIAVGGLSARLGWRVGRGPVCGG